MKRLVCILTSLLTASLIGSVAFAGTITGTVTARGVRRPESVVIYIEKVGDNNFEPPQEAAAILDQKNLTFIPHVMPLLVGTTVDFPNSDTVRHNVFSPSKVNKFNLGTYPVGETKSVIFDKPGLVSLLCNVHAEMSAFVLTLKNPYFAVTDKKGKFSIPNGNEKEDAETIGAMKIAKVASKYKNLPAGKYILKTWHEKLKSQTIEVTVPAEGEVKVNFQLRRGKSPRDLYKEKKK